VLGVVLTDYLYHKYPNRDEGELTAYRAALVNAETLGTVAAELGVNDHLLLSRGEAKDNGRARQVILANTFEAIVGAMYLDQGYAAAQIFIGKYLLPLTDEIVAKKLWVDAKSYFQEQAQELRDITPTYKVLSELGPDHDKVFTVGLYLGSELVAKGQGPSKQRAEQEAARAGLAANGWDLQNERHT
jgi:ribonuclease-3